MGYGDSISKKLYMRELSNEIHKWSPQTMTGVLFVAEDPVISINAGLAKQIIILLCRNKQRILKQAWQYWTKNANVIHDYSLDVRMILSRAISPYAKRTELEIEVLYKWCQQKAPIDSTSICHAVVTCKKKDAIICVLQYMRIEFYKQKDTLLYQSARPRPEDGQFTILSGEVDVVQLQEGSVTLLRLQYFYKKKQFNSCKAVLKKAHLLGSLKAPAGFGDLSTLTDTPRSASLTVSSPTAEAVVTPKHAIMYCIENKRTMNEDGETHNEQELGVVMDFLVQAGLANRISPADLYLAATNMTKRVLTRGEVLFVKGEPVVDLYLVVSGDFLLDLSDNIVHGAYVPFAKTTPNMCFCLGTHSVLGDEGLAGIERCFESTAVVVSTAAFIYTVSGFAKQYVKQRLQASRYAALTYRDLPKLTPPIYLAESINIYSQLNSLRKAFASSCPFRGSLEGYITNSSINRSYELAHSKSKALTGDLSVCGDDTAVYEDVYESSALGSAGDTGNGSRNTSADIGIDQASIGSGAKLGPGHTAVSFNDKIRLLPSRCGERALRAVSGGTLATVMLIYRAVKQRERAQISSSAQGNIIDDQVQEMNKKAVRGKISREMLAKSDTQLRVKMDEYNAEMAERLRRLQVSLKAETETDFTKAAEARSLFASMASAGIAGADDNATASAASMGAQPDAEDMAISEGDKEILGLTKLAQFYRYKDLTEKPPDDEADFHKVKNKFHLKKKKAKCVYNVSYATVPPAHPVPTPGELRIPWRPSSRPASPAAPLLLVDTATAANKTANSSSRAISRPTNPQQYLDKAALQRHNFALANSEQKEVDEINESFQQMGDFSETVDAPQTTTLRNNLIEKKEGEDKFFRPLPPTNIRNVLSVAAFSAIINPSNTGGLKASTKYAGAKRIEGITDLSWLVQESITMQDPEDFIDFLKRTDFDKRKEHRPDKSWQTRFMRAQQERPPLLPSTNAGARNDKVDDQGFSKSLSFSIRKKLMSLRVDAPVTPSSEKKVKTIHLAAIDFSAAEEIGASADDENEKDACEVSRHSNCGVEEVPNHIVDSIDNHNTGDRYDEDHHDEVGDSSQSAAFVTDELSPREPIIDKISPFSPANPDLAIQRDHAGSDAQDITTGINSKTKRTKLASAATATDIFATIERGGLKQANPSSASIDKYNMLISAEPASRKFLDGRKNAGFGSKFQLPKDLSLLVERATLPTSNKVLSSDPMALTSAGTKQTKRALEHVTEKALPHNVKKFFEKRRNEDSDVIDRMSNIILDSMTFTTNARVDIKRKQLLMYSEDDGNQSISSNLPKAAATNNSKDGINGENEEKVVGSHDDDVDDAVEDVDPLLSWQLFSCDRAAKTNVGPKRTLPVLLDGGKAGAVKSAALSKFGRNLAYIPAASELDALIEPPSYLEVFSNKSVRPVWTKSGGNSHKNKK